MVPYLGNIVKLSACLTRRNFTGRNFFWKWQVVIYTLYDLKLRWVIASKTFLRPQDSLDQLNLKTELGLSSLAVMVFLLLEYLMCLLYFCLWNLQRFRIVENLLGHCPQMVSFQVMYLRTLYWGNRESVESVETFSTRKYRVLKWCFIRAKSKNMFKWVHTWIDFLWWITEIVRKIHIEKVLKCNR